jgi:hypothetical protein
VTPASRLRSPDWIWRLLWQLAGIVGLNPGPFTLRELVWMADARQTDDWNHTAALLALLANVHRDPRKTHPFQPADFHPGVQRTQRPHDPHPKVDITVLKTVFVERGFRPQATGPMPTSPRLPEV